MTKEDVTYINAHGTSTNYNDKVRACAGSLLAVRRSLPMRDHRPWHSYDAIM